MKLVPERNPPNPWLSQHVEYFGEAPRIELSVYEDHSKGILSENDSPDLARLREGAGAIARLAPQVTGWFPPGTGPDIGKTRAKAEIWQKPEDFAAKRAAFQRSARAFNAAAFGEDLATIRAAHADLGKTCKACHDPYRAEEKGHDD